MNNLNKYILILLLTSAPALAEPLRYQQFNQSKEVQAVINRSQDHIYKRQKEFQEMIEVKKQSREAILFKSHSERLLIETEVSGELHLAQSRLETAKREPELIDHLLHIEAQLSHGGQADVQTVQAEAFKHLSVGEFEQPKSVLWFFSHPDGAHVAAKTILDAQIPLKQKAHLLSSAVDLSKRDIFEPELFKFDHLRLGCASRGLIAETEKVSHLEAILNELNSMAKIAKKLAQALEQFEAITEPHAE